MIGYFPALYDDELVYSWIARYFVHSGYTSAADTYLDLYENSNVRPSVELLNNLTYDCKSVLIKYMPMETLILEHTMFPEYGRFIEPSTRERLLTECDFTHGNWINNLIIPTSMGERYLKYCPLCVSEDYDNYGETYWHRKHQINGIRICVKHRVWLQNSDILINRNLTRLKAAEIVVTKTCVTNKCDDDVIIKLASYMEKIFYSQKYSHDHIGRYLNGYITPRYIHNNGNRKMYVLYADYVEFYKSLNLSEIMSVNSMCRLLGGHRGTYGNICQLGLFLGIDPLELLNKGDEVQDDDIFLRVSQVTGEPLGRVHLIGKAIIEELKKESVLFIKGKRHEDNIEKEDLALLPSVESIVKKIYGEGDARPRKVSLYAISKQLHIDIHKLKNMERCVAMINQYYESQEEYWAREIIWAVNQIQNNNEPLNIKHIRNYTNMKRGDMESSLKHIKKLDADLYNNLQTVIK